MSTGKLFPVKPGVSDPETELLVNEKVDAFWRGIEGGANKRGTVSTHLMLSVPTM